MPSVDTGYFKNSAKRKSLRQNRTIKNKFIAWKLDREYYDGERINGYGGYKYDGRWKTFLPKIIQGVLPMPLGWLSPRLLHECNKCCHRPSSTTLRGLG